MRILASLALVPGLVFAQTPAQSSAPTKVTSVEGITEYRLATYMVGSRFEG